MQELLGKIALVFVEDNYEDLELWYPVLRLREAGAEVLIAGPEKDHSYVSKHGYPCVADIAIRDVSPERYHLLIIPGGFAPDRLRRSQHVKDITRAMHEAGKPIAHICHGGWVPVSANILDGFRCTSTVAIADDIRNAGGRWEDAEVVVDRNQISSRKPDDLPAFMQAVIAVAKG
ncbi:type 1 glutamine amidotransferase domain-containing protein [Desulfobaculum bizertense]|uniref:Protease I n=1 Tax=Desulfobaculum bizertense DSM 18034 TaxID=1121442 RepID=A0A1T4VKI1_9BACT|nr:type 1 glutamine amidotransferase domain-containing protein [Desulfobaculum bizertense]UIJ38081.1 type 1 glutamine amidotransferase [Desulfobaculum bizertense]SKA65472.1 protease I [Desulfobaculum bizertense DSM 18034]